MSAMYDVSVERNRQIFMECYDHGHDDEYINGELIVAAVAYAQSAFYNVMPFLSPHWPWDPKLFKPYGRRRDLVRAAALLIAEIERLDRAEAASREV